MAISHKPVEFMQERFSKCPICKSEKGFELSPFYPNVQCKSCGAEWLLFKDGMQLKKASKHEWDSELLENKRSFEFWMKLKIPKQWKKKKAELDQGFLAWDDKQLRQFVLQLVALGEGWDKISRQAMVPQALTGGINWMQFVVSTGFYTKAAVMELERLNRKIDKLIKEISLSRQEK